MRTVLLRSTHYYAIHYHPLHIHRPKPQPRLLQTTRFKTFLRSLAGMAWSSSGATNEELIENMRKGGLIESDFVADAMKKVDRANYVRNPRYAYEDAPQSIGNGATISAPHMHAHACQYLLPWIHRDAHVLDVGSGSGYTAAVFYHLLQSASASQTSGSEASGSDSSHTGLVVGIDHIPQLVSWSVDNLKKDGLTSALSTGEAYVAGESGTEPVGIVMVAGDGRQGWSRGSPYDVIHVGAAAPVIPTALVDMLKSPGRMFIPVGPDGGEQDVWTVDKDNEGNVTKKKLFGVRYVPLTDQNKQMRGY